jgi:hypothetical protein
MLSSVATLASTTTIAGPSIAPHIDEASRAAALDPIFAAIEIHRAAVRAHSDAVSFESDIADTPVAREQHKLIDGMEARLKSALAAGEHGDEQDKMFQGIIAKAMENDGNRFSANMYMRRIAMDLVHMARPELFAERPDDEEAALQAARTRSAEACWATDDAAIAMIDSPPTTLAGVISLLTYVAHHGAADGVGFPEDDLDDENGEPASAIGGPAGFHCLVHRCAVDALTKIAAQAAAAEGGR